MPRSKAIEVVQVQQWQVPLGGDAIITVEVYEQDILLTDPSGQQFEFPAKAIPAIISAIQSAAACIKPPKRIRKPAQPKVDKAFTDAAAESKAGMDAARARVGKAQPVMLRDDDFDEDGVFRGRINA